MTRGVPRLRASQGAADWPTGLRVCAEAGWGIAGQLGPKGGPTGRRGGRGRLLDRGDCTPSQRLGPREAMLWFQGSIPAAIASAKRSGAVFVVFLAGEGGGSPRCGRDTPSGLPPTTGASRLSSVPREVRAARPWLLSVSSVRLGHTSPFSTARFSQRPARRHRRVSPSKRAALRPLVCAGRGDASCRPWSPLRAERPFRAPAGRVVSERAPQPPLLGRPDRPLRPRGRRSGWFHALAVSSV